jgi:hypothetical protein
MDANATSDGRCGEHLAVRWRNGIMANCFSPTAGVACDLGAKFPSQPAADLAFRVEQTVQRINGPALPE